VDRARFSSMTVDRPRVTSMTVDRATNTNADKSNYTLLIPSQLLLAILYFAEPVQEPI
jgi:hypothetical protein